MPPLSLSTKLERARRRNKLLQTELKAAQARIAQLRETLDAVGRDLRAPSTPTRPWYTRFLPPWTSTTPT